MDNKKRKVEVYARHTMDNEIIPVSIQFVDDDGFRNTYQVHSYKRITKIGDFNLPDRPNVTNDRWWIFDCKIVILNILQVVRLQYNSKENEWVLL